MAQEARDLAPVGAVPGVYRPRLQLSLDAAVVHRVCVVTGAAGWGKTMAVASWSRGAPTVWMRQDGRDRSDRGFARMLTDSLRDRISAPPVCLSDPVTVEGADGYVDACCRWLSQALTGELVLVIDDLHTLTPDPVAMRILAGLCRGGPDRLHLLLLSRCELPFSLARLRGRGSVAEIDARDLAFDVDEVAQLLQATIGTHPTSLAEQVWLRTGGWPAATSLVVEALHDVKPGRRSSLLPQLMRPLRYLVEEVIEREPEMVRQVLHRMAVSGGRGAAAAAVIGDGEDPSCVADLVRRGLMHPVQGHDDRWSLVPPVQDYFDQQLSPASRVLLHRRAARHHLDRGAPAEAMWHLRASGDHSACASLLVDHGDALVSGGRFDAVLEAAELPAVHLADERIQRVVGQAWQALGQWASAQECFRRAGDAPGELEPALAWRVALVAYGQAQFDEVLAVCARARLAAESTMDEVRVLSLAANACRMVGDYAGCRERADRAMAAADRCGQPAARASVYLAHAKLASAEGDQRRADGYSQSAIEAAEAAGDVLQSHWAQLVRAFQLADTGQSEAALAHIEGVLQLGESSAERRLQAQALNLRGTVHVHRGLIESALDDLAASRDLSQQLGSRFLAWPLCGLGDIDRMRGRLDSARARYEEALALAEPCHDVLALGSALTGLARVRAVDDTAAARGLAERALALGEGARAVQARLTRGWITLMEGDHETAAVDAALAADTARARCDNPGLAEALVLTVLATAQPSQHRGMLAEAIEILRDAGRPIEEAQVRMVDSRLGRGIGAEAVRAEQTVRDYGVHMGPGAAAGPLAVLTRFAPSVSIHALGTFQVVRDGEAVPKNAWRSRKARDLLKILVARRRPVPRERLIELLWPDSDPSQAGNRLSVLLSTVRDVLQPRGRRSDDGPLVTDDTAVWLDPARVRVDVEEFLTEAAAALDADRDHRLHAAARLAAAERMVGGDFLEGDPQQEWAVSLGEEIRATHMAVLRALSARLRAGGDLDGAVGCTLRLLEHDPYDEQAHLDLVAMQLEAGHFGEAQCRYRIYVQQMTELGVEPRLLQQLGGQFRRVG